MWTLIDAVRTRICSRRRSGAMRPHPVTTRSQLLHGMLRLFWAEAVPNVVLVVAMIKDLYINLKFIYLYTYNDTTL